MASGTLRAPRYVATDLTPAGWKQVIAGSLNDDGECVGRGLDRQGVYHALVWKHGRMSEIGFGLPGRMSAAISINRKGQIIALLLNNAVLWNGKRAIRIVSSRRTEIARPAAINNLGQVVGSLYIIPFSPYLESGFLWSRGHLRKLPLANALGVNDHGTVLGILMQQRPGHSIPIPHTVLWEHGRIYDIGALPGESDAFGKAINNAGEVIGRSGRRGFFYSNHRMTRIGWLPNLHPGTTANPLSINDRGEVVGAQNGWLESPGEPRRMGSLAFIWRNGSLFDLNDLVAVKKGWKLTSALAINNRGEILAREESDTDAKVVLLRPAAVFVPKG